MPLLWPLSEVRVISQADGRTDRLVWKLRYAPYFQTRLQVFEFLALVHVLTLSTALALQDECGLEVFAGFLYKSNTCLL